MRNREKLRQNNARPGGATAGAPREGAALLIGLAICGRCGRRMGAHYEARSPRWRYVCWGESRQGDKVCWSVPGPAIDRAVEQLFVETMVPSELDLSLAVDREVGKQAASLDSAWRARVEQAEYEARRAERRYKAVDPDNRVVARTLEREWEERLRALQEVQREHAEARREARVELTADDRERIRELARDLPTVWAAHTTAAADRKAMLRLVIEAIALHPVDVPKRMTSIRVQWQSGIVTDVEVARPSRGRYQTHAPEVLQRIRQLAAAGLGDEEIAERLHRDGLRTGRGLDWTARLVVGVRRQHRIVRVTDKPRIAPLPHRHPDGRYSVPGAAARFGVSHNVVHWWIQHGHVPAERADFGTHRNVYWLDIDETTAVRLAARIRRPKTRKV